MVCQLIPAAKRSKDAASRNLLLVFLVIPVKVTSILISPLSSSFLPGDVQGGPHQRGSLSGAGTPGTASPLSSDWVFRSVLVLMISLLCANSLLFYKMWFLETRLRWVG